MSNRFQGPGPGARASLALLSSAVAFGLAATPAFAQAPTTLPEVTVSATRVEQSTLEVPATISVITAREIQLNLVQSLLDLVRYEPGVTVLNDPSRSGLQSFNIRGLDGNRVLMQVDGIRTPEFFSFGVNNFNTATRNLVDPESLKTVEILRGPASSLYGSDALGGVVTFITKDPSDYLTGDRNTYFGAKAAYASVDNGVWGTLTGAARSGPWDTLIVVTQRHGDQMENMGSNGSTGPSRTEPNPQDFDGTNVLGKLVYNIDAKQRIRLTGEYLDTKTETDVLTLNASTPRTSSLTADDTARRSRVSLDYDLRGPNDSPFSAATAQLYWQSSAARSQTDEIRTGTSASCSGTASGSSTCFIPRIFNYDTDTWGAQAQAEQRFVTGSVGHRLIYGAEVVRTETTELRDATIFNRTTGSITKTLAGDVFPVRDFPDSTTTTTGIYIQNEIAFDGGRLLVTPGLRYDYYKLEVHPDEIYTSNAPPGATAHDFSDDAFSPKIAASWAVTDTDRVYGQYAHGFRAPPFTDMNTAFRNPVQQYTLIPNPDLVSEKSWGVELGVKGDRPGLRYGVAAFYNRYKDFIDPQVMLDCPADPRCVPGFMITFQAINRGRVTIQGAEAKAEWTFLPEWTLVGSLAYAKGEDDDLDTPLNSILPPTAVLGVRYTSSDNLYGGAAMVTGVMKKRTGDIDGNVFPTPGFGLLDLTAWWSFAPGATLNVGVFNVFDKKYWMWGDVYNSAISPTSSAIDRYTQPGRNVGVSVSFAL